MIFASLLLVVIADLFFYKAVPGWTVGAYVLLAAALLRLRGGRQRDDLPGWILVAALAGIAIALAVHPGPLGVTLAAIGLMTLVLTAREGWTWDAPIWFRRWLRFLRRMPLEICRDLSVLERAIERRGVSRWSRFSSLGKWVVPVLLSLVFVVLFWIANPLIARWIQSLGTWLGDLLRSLDDLFLPLRVALWALVGTVAWAFLRLRTGIRATAEGPTFVCDRPVPVMRADGIVRCLILFNAIFAVQIVLDMVYLWGGASLPEGMTYAEYAHRGAYPLVVTALLAATFVLVVFRPGERDPGMLRARWLVVLWIFQNVLLTGSSLWRLHLYVEVYSLTRLRIAAGIWMFLVAIGLVSIVWRILARRDNRWLVGVNTAMALAVLYVCCFVDFDARIAWYNVRHSREVTGEGTEVDLAYLRSLGPEAMPALTWLSERIPRIPKGEAAASLASILRRDLDRQLADWRGWTWIRYCLSRTTKPVESLASDGGR